MQEVAQRRSSCRATELDHVFGKRCLVAGVTVDHQRTAVITEETPGVFAAAAGAKVERDERWSDAASIDEQITAMGFPRARLKHGDRGLVGMQHGLCLQLAMQAVHQ